MAGKDDLSAVKGFLGGNGVNRFTHTLDEDGSIWAAFGVGSQPAVAFINDDGTIEVRQGAIGEEELAERIENLLAT